MCSLSDILKIDQDVCLNWDYPAHEYNVNLSLQVRFHSCSYVTDFPWPATTIYVLTWAVRLEIGRTIDLVVTEICAVLFIDARGIYAAAFDVAPSVCAGCYTCTYVDLIQLFILVFCRTRLLRSRYLNWVRSDLEMTPTMFWPTLTICLTWMVSKRNCKHICSVKHYTPYSARMNPENTHQLMGFYMEALILGIIHVL